MLAYILNYSQTNTHIHDAHCTHKYTPVALFRKDITALVKIGTSGAHTTCCEEKFVLRRVPSPAPGALLAPLTVPA